MCPDRDLISSYVDGEVPSPWRERLEEHFASCPSCAALAARYAELGKELRNSAPFDETQALARGRERLDLLLRDIPADDTAYAFAREKRFFASLWSHSVHLPLPLAAAAAILVLLLGGATAMLAFRPGRSDSIRTIASGEIPAQAIPAAQPASMDELLRYLDSSAGQVTLTINLPTGTTFGTAGKPVIMRSPQALRGAVDTSTTGGRSP
jgi:Predicted transmembrane transcriptional regulator (anti-sigma factor)